MLQIKVYIMIYLAKLMYGFGKISTTLIYAQAVHETGNFKSVIFKENNNLFGMRQAKKRKSFATGSNRAHAVFKTHWDSIRDYFERQKNFRVSSENDQAFIKTTLSSNYAEDPQYKAKWEAIASTVKKPVNGLFLGIIFFFLLASIAIIKTSNNKKTIK